MQAECRAIPVNSVGARGVAQDRAFGDCAGQILDLPSRFSAVPRFEEFFLFVVDHRTPGAAVVLPGLDLTEHGVQRMFFGRVKDLPHVVESRHQIEIDEDLRGVADERDRVCRRGRPVQHEIEPCRTETTELHLITTSIEHSAIIQAANKLANFGVQTTFVAPQPSGLIDPHDILRAIRPETRLISVMLANNETGVLQPVAEIGKIAADTGVFFHIDAVQGAGKVKFDVRQFGCHLLSISGHKVHGPKGVGAMFVRRGTPVESLIVGGSHERRRRAGTENVPGIVGLAKAVELAMHSLEDGTMTRLAVLRDKLEAGVLALPATGLNGALPDGKPAPRAANTTNIWFDNLEGEALVIALDLKGIAVSGGSACHSGATEPSHVLMAMGLDKARARASLRFSLMKTATEAQIDRVLQIVPEAVQQLRSLSPVAAGTLG